VPVKILVCMKQVPQKDAPLKLNESGTWIRDDVSYEVNEPDAYALEEALRQKEKHGGEVVVITSGPVRAQRWPREPTAPFISKATDSSRWMPSTPPRRLRRPSKTKALI
jgi:electron transfer flavoprotein beta subunit